MSESYLLLVPQPNILVPHPAYLITTARLFEGPIPRLPYGRGVHYVEMPYPETQRGADYEKPALAKSVVSSRVGYATSGPRFRKSFPLPVR